MASIVYWCGSIFLIAAIVLFKSIYSKIEYSKKEVIVGGILGIVLCIMLSVDELITCIQQNLIIKFFVLGIFAFSAIIMMCFCVHMFLQENDKDKEKSCYIKQICMLFITLVSVACVISTYPGCWIQADVETVRQFVSGESICSDWHTIGYLLFVKLCYKIYPSIYVVNIVQCIMWQVINWCALSLLDRDCEGQKPMVVYTMISIMFFAPYYYLQIMYKDVVFSMCLFATTLFLIYFIKTENITWILGINMTRTSKTA